MASEMLGRCICPECGFESAHIKIKTDKPDAKPYRHCPECGSQYFPRSVDQANLLRGKIKAAKIEEKHAPIIEPEPAPAKKFKTVFGVQVPA